MTKKLTPKQELFCKEYVIDFNATQAAIRAGYKKKAAYKTASENLNKPHVAERIRELQGPVMKKPEITRERVLQELADIAFANTDDFFEGPGVLKKDIMKSDKLGAIATFEPTMAGVKVKMNDKQKALEMLARHLGMFNADTSQKPETNQYDFSKISSEKLRKIRELLSGDE